MKKLATALFVSSLLAGSAGAADFDFTVTKSNSTISCAPKQQTASTGDHATVTFHVGDGITVEKVKVTGGGHEKIVSAQQKGVTATASLARGVPFAPSTAVTVAVSATGTNGFVPCGEDSHLLFAAASGQGAPAPAPPPPTGLLDGAAQEWWVTNRAARTQDLLDNGKGALPHGTLLLVHLPSGQPAYAFPAAITEGTPVQMAIILPRGIPTAPKLDPPKSCEPVNPFRTTFDETAGGKQAVRETQSPTVTGFTVLPVGQFMKCGAGKLEYTITAGIDPAVMKSLAAGGKQAATESDKEGAPKSDEQKASGDGAKPSTPPFDGTTIRVRPKYQVAAVAVGVWDFARRTRFEKLNTATAGTSTIGAVDERVGLSMYVGAQWMIGGVDFEDMHCTNYFANLIVAANPKSPLDDVIVGIGLTPTGGVSVTGGVSIHSNRRLTGGYKVGAAFTGDGDIPSEKTWNDAGVGPFVGLSLDSRVYDALVKRFGQK